MTKQVEIAGRSMSVREGTWDEAICRSILEGNEYGLPDMLAPDDLVIDVGAHIGGFTTAAWARGSRNIIAYEPNPESYDLLVANTESLDGVAIHRSAVWKSGQSTSLLCAPSPRPYFENTGGVEFLYDKGQVIAYTVGLDAVIGKQPVRFLKLDCEGAEFPILLTSERLGQVEEVSMEFHEMATGRGDDPFKEIPEAAQVSPYERYEAEMLATILARHGMTVTTFYRHGEHQTSRLGVLHARRGK